MTRREFLSRSKIPLIGLATGGLGIAGLAQDADAPGVLARGMITPEAQRAIDMGLAFLARNQINGNGGLGNDLDGAFGTGHHRGNVAISSLAGLAFLAGGSQPDRGQYGSAVTRAIRYVLSQESRAVRGFLNNSNAMRHGPMYSHGFGTLFLAEVCGMVADPGMRTQVNDTLERAVQLIVNTQNHEGGWRYQPRRNDADISVTICQIMALRAARNAGYYVLPAVAQRCIDYVKSCQDRHSGGFRYQNRIGGRPGFARTAAGVVALYSAGQYDGPEVENGLRYLMNHIPGGNNNDGGFGFGGRFEQHYYYGHYYAVQAMWIAGGNYWRRWYPAIREELLDRAPNGHRNADGSWFHMRGLCRHYCTAMASIILQVPNNYLPIFQR